MTADDDMHRLLNKMADERDRLISRLGAADATIWLARELCLEWVAIHSENSPWNADLIRRQDRLLTETRAFLNSTPEVVQLPTTDTGRGRGEAPAAGTDPNGDAA